VRIRGARVEEQSTVESFDFTANTKHPAATLRDLSCTARARRRRNSHPLRTRRSRENPYGTSTWPCRRDVDVRFAKASRVGALRPRWRPCRSHVGSTRRDYTKPLV
jgi:hypothetical protein